MKPLTHEQIVGNVADFLRTNFSDGLWSEPHPDNMARELIRLILDAHPEPTPNKQKILEGENDRSIDAFQMYADNISIGRSEYDVLNQESFFKALVYFLSALPTDTQITKRKIGEWYKDTVGTTKDEQYRNNIIDWLDSK